MVVSLCVVVCLRVRALLRVFVLLFVNYCVLLHVFVCDPLCDGVCIVLFVIRCDWLCDVA